MTVVDGVTLHVEVHGPAAAPGIVLVHGGDAHGGWWEPVLPRLVDRFRCVVPDLSGFGYSDHAQRYSFERWADEVMAAARAGDIRGRPVVVGHSQGGVTALVAAHRHGAALAGVVAVDACLRRWSAEELAPFHRRAARGHRAYRDRDALTGRFALHCLGREVPAPVLSALARRAVVHGGAGWRWRFDPRTVEQEPIGPQDLAPARCPVALVAGEHGLTTGPMNDAVATALGPPSTSVHQLDGVGHHAPVEAPDAVAALVAGLAERWTTA